MPLFHGSQSTTEMELRWPAIFAALIATLLILLITLTLIVLQARASCCYWWPGRSS